MSRCRVNSWPDDFGAHPKLGPRLARERALEHADGVRTAVDWRRWCSRPDNADGSVLMRVEGTTLDVGCGPGRLTVAWPRMDMRSSEST